MASMEELLGSIGLNFGGSGLITTIIAILLGTIVLGLCMLFLWWIIFKRKKWNLKIEFRIPRNVKKRIDADGEEYIDGNITKEWGKGFYDYKKGVVTLKRKGKKPVQMKPFDIKKFLSENHILTVIQIGSEEYRPVIDDSYLEVVDDETGEEAALIRARIDTSESKSWKNTFEREAKNAYTIKNWLREHGQMLSLGIVILMICVGFAIVISRLPK